MEQLIINVKELLKAINNAHPQINVGDEKQLKLYNAYHVVSLQISEIELKGNKTPCYNCAEYEQGSNPDRYCMICNRMIDI